jgi:hypothetical protein
MNAFDQAWDLIVKMPYYHGTSTRFEDEIKEVGLDPSESLSSLEQEDLDDLEGWLEEHDFDYDDFDPDENWMWFAKDNPLATMAYALATNNQYGSDRHSPVIYEIADDDVYDAVPDYRNDGVFRGSYRSKYEVSPDKIKEFFRFRPMERGEGYDEYRTEMREAIKQRMGEQ